MTTLGIDPGDRQTGFCLLGPRQEVMHAVVIERALDDWQHYIVELRDQIRSAPVDSLAAIEGVVPPRAHHRGKKQFISIGPVIGVARALGACQLAAMDMDFPVVIVPPSGNGSGEREAYPAQLWGDREGPAGSGWRRHCRSAYDVALAGQKIAAGEDPNPIDRAQLARLHEVRAEHGI